VIGAAPARPAPPAGAPPPVPEGGIPARAVLEDTATTLAAAGATALGAVALTPVYTDRSWVPPVLSAVAVVAAAGLLLRTAGAALWAARAGDRPVPPLVGALGVPLVPLGQLALLTCLMTALFAPADAIGGWLPTRDSLAALGSVMADGSVELREQATPALPLTGLLALTVLLVGAVAVVVDLIAVGGRQPALAGLGLLVLYCVPVSTVTGTIGLLPVAAPAAGLALLLWADQHRRLAARQDTETREGRRPLLGRGTAVAVRTATAAVAVGVVVGSVVPTLTEGTLARGFGSGGGGSTGTALDPAAALQGQLTLDEPIELLWVDASVDDPGYLRVVALEEYDTVEGWSVGNLDGERSVADDDQLAPLPGRRAGRQVEALVTALGHDDRFLPVLHSPLSVSVADSDRWRFDPGTSTVFGRDTGTAGRTWSVTAVEPRPTIEQLVDAGELPPGSAIAERFTRLPPLDPSVTELVAGLTAGAANPYERVRAIYEHFTAPANGYRYSLSTAPGTSGDDLVDFLRLRQGYCEQYAGAMAVLVRAAGVPARVVLGYTPGTVQPDGTRLVTSDDAHAWVEAYFDDLGWVPFDPTPIDADRAVDLPWSPRTEDQEADPRADAPAAPLPGPVLPAPQLEPGPQAIPLPSTTLEETSWTRPVLTGLGAVLGLALLGAVPAGLRVLQRRRRLADGGATALWDELTATAADLGIELDPARTPRQVAEQLTGSLPGTGGGRGGSAADAVRRLARAEETASYARPGPAPAEPELREALATGRRGLLRAAPRAARLRARFLPVSLLPGLHPRSWWPAGRPALRS
jgi:TgpA N-terminal domain/Transglutaminase-like superfamily